MNNGESKLYLIYNYSSSKKNYNNFKLKNGFNNYVFTFLTKKNIYEQIWFIRYEILAQESRISYY